SGVKPFFLTIILRSLGRYSLLLHPIGSCQKGTLVISAFLDVPLTKNQENFRSLDKRECLSQIHSLHLWIIAKLFWTACAENAALVDDVSAVGYGKRFTHVVVGDQYPNTASF